VAGNKRPSFLKRQKEQKRTARAAEKREARRIKKQGRVTDGDDPGTEPDSEFGDLSDLMDGPDDVEQPDDAEENGKEN